VLCVIWGGLNIVIAQDRRWSRVIAYRRVLDSFYRPAESAAVGLKCLDIRSREALIGIALRVVQTGALLIHSV
jgi:hypothetical protein